MQLLKVSKRTPSFWINNKPFIYKKKLRWARKKVEIFKKELSYIQGSDIELYYNRLWHFPLIQLENSRINSTNSSKKFKKTIIQLFVNKYIEFKKERPELNVILLMNFPNIRYNSKILALSDDCLKTFFENRNTDEEKRILLDEKRNFIKELNLKIPEDFKYKIRGYKIIITDKDGYYCECESWYVWDL